MSAKKYIVEFSIKQRKKLKALSSRGKVEARKLNRARILLLADSNRPKGEMTDAAINEILGISLATIARTRRKFFAQQALELTQRFEITIPQQMAVG